MNGNFSLIVLLIFFTACHLDNRKSVVRNNGSIAATEPQITKQPSAQELIQKMLDLPQWQWVYHPEVNGRLPVKMLKNDFVADSLILIKFNQKVQIGVDTRNTKEYVEIEKLKIKDDTAYFIMEYPSEGAVANGHFIKRNKVWMIDKYTVIEQ